MIHSKQTPDEVLDEHHTQDHVKLLMKAEAIKSDPEKMAKVNKMAGRHMGAVKGLGDLKDIYNQKYGPKKAAPDAEDLKDQGVDELDETKVAAKAIKPEHAPKKPEIVIKHEHTISDPSQLDPADAAHEKMLNSFKQKKPHKLTASQSESSNAWLKRLSEVGQSSK